ncbi:hypothetical protein ACVWWO_004028 [Bradyrhizobium sp. F1.13.1]
MPLTPEVLATQGDVVAWLGSLDVSFATDEEPWFTVDGIESPRQIGSDGSGGAFVLLPSQNVLYVSSDGRAGIIAKSFEAFVKLVVAHPYWLDILKFSAGGDLHEMRRAADALEATLDDEDDVNEAREQIRGGLDLPEANDPVGALYDAVGGLRRRRAGHRRQPVHDAVQPLQHRQQPDAAQRGGVVTSPIRPCETPALCCRRPECRRCRSRPSRSSNRYGSGFGCRLAPRSAAA